MVCKKCGAEVPSGSFYCNVCGAEIQMVSEYNLEDDIVASYIGVDEKKAAESAVTRVTETASRTTRALGKQRFPKLALLFAACAVGVGVLIGGIFIHVQNVRSAEENTYDYQINQALKYFNSVDYEMAIAHFDKALAIVPDDIVAMEYLAQCYTALGEYSAAESIYRSLISLDNANQGYFEKLVALFEAEGDYEKIRDLAGLTDDADVLAYLAEFEVPVPLFSHDSGEYDDDLTISLISKNDEIIYYTTDGSDPVENGRLYTDVIRFEGEGHYLLKAVCQNSLNLYSDVVDQEYAITYRAPGAPVVNLPTGIYSGQQILSIEVPEDCTAYYTLDGTTPTTKSYPYQSPIILPAGGQYVVTVVYVSPHGKVGSSASFSYIITE